ncbi:GNAT family N-acetyltransferase [Rubrivivax gelatinosus]|nr:GNAT family N-acetyltransferase [Rubrivivax gelatinosus]
MTTWPEQLAAGAFALRPAVLADAPAVFDAHQDAVLHLCAAAYTPAQMAAWFEGRTPAIHHPAIEAGQMTLAERDGRVLGFCAAVPGEVTLLFVRPEAAGSGLGSRLLQVALAQARRGHDGPLTVVATRNSQRFYERHGFAAVEHSFFVRGAADTRVEVVVMRGAPPAAQVVPLAERPDLIPLIRGWFEAEWPAWYGPGGPGQALHDLQACAQHDALPLGLVARLDNHPCGFMALKRDGLASLPHLGPWVGAAVVLPGLRRLGIGRALLLELERRAAALGETRLYCATATAASLLQHCGWRRLERVAHGGEMLDLYDKRLAG